MTSKEVIKNHIESLKEQAQIEKELKTGSEIYCEIEIEHYNEVLKDLEVLEILKEFMQDADTGTGWIEININPEHDILDSEEWTEKQKIIRKWLNEEE